MTDIRQEAYKIINKVFSKNLFSNHLLHQVMDRNAFSKRDHDFLSHLVKGVIKMKGNLDYIISCFVDEDKYENTPLKIRILLYLGLYQLRYCDFIPAHAAVHETVELAKRIFNDAIGAFVNAVLRAYLRSPGVDFPSVEPSRLAVQYSFPISLIEKWIEYWGVQDTEKLCNYFNQNPRLSIRVNRFATDRSKLIEYFQRRGIMIEPSKASENIAITDQIHEVMQNVAFSEGYFSIQDAAAALVVELLEPEQNEAVLDMFAGPGGKTSYISELMDNTGEVIAIDKIPAKIKKVKQNLDRLQIKNVKVLAMDAFKYGPRAAAFDRVLLDVPCSGWGVFQKKPELRWQLNQDMSEILKLQKKALKTGAAFVKRNGIMLYSTCTMNPEENQKQVEEFLAHNKDFILEDASRIIPASFTDRGYLSVIPFKHHLDGTFAARMRKKG